MINGLSFRSPHFCFCTECELCVCYTPHKASVRLNETMRANSDMKDILKKKTDSFGGVPKGQRVTFLNVSSWLLVMLWWVSLLSHPFSSFTSCFTHLCLKNWDIEINLMNYLNWEGAEDPAVLKTSNWALMVCLPKQGHNSLESDWGSFPVIYSQWSPTPLPWTGTGP